MLPILFESDYLTLYSYPLLYGFAIGLGYHLCKILLFSFKQSDKGFNKLFIGAIVSAWIGAKVFFLIHSGGANSSVYASASSFWLGGGFVFYGGLVFGLVFVLIYTLLLKKFDFQKIKFFTVSIALSHAVGRIGCFLAGCCFGNVCHLGVCHLLPASRHPVQLYEVFMLIVLAFILLKLLKSKFNSSFIINWSYLAGYGFIRFILEFFRGDSIRGGYGFLSTSQVVSIVLLICFVVHLGVRKIKSLR